jgi:hypothetical protein
MRRTFTTFAALSLLVALWLGASAQGVARRRVAHSGPTHSTTHRFTTDLIIDVSGYVAPRQQTSHDGRRSRLNRVNRRPQIR